MLRHSLKTGLSFGLTSGIITTLGLMVGLNSGTHSKLVVIGGILVIAVSDAFSDALGIHVSEESELKHAARELWESTIFTFLSKFVFALTFVIPLPLFPLSTAIIASAAWGLTLLGVFSFYVAKEQRATPWKVVFEHVVVASAVIVVPHYVGGWIGSTFGEA